MGFDEHSESILRNAETVTAAILRTIAEQLGDTRLLVGGFSMGGLVTRYALAKMEMQRMDHRTGVHLSFDSPHRGAWVPIGLQAFAHYLAQTGDDTYLRQISSPAAQQMLFRYLDGVKGTPQESPLRTEFKERLQQVGSWPRIPMLLGVSSGRGDGVGNGCAGRGEGADLRRTALRRYALPRPVSGRRGGGRTERRPRRPALDHHERPGRTGRSAGRDPRIVRHPR
ncbi:hypothetical protein ACFXKG_12985 [Streptomyces sp. NPDC059255]|uniref:alpha/beta hydrolase n=1 Tax=Streptomyces sp. NPDC059255 TaxID=3346793 RepID=UPI003676B42C